MYGWLSIGILILKKDWENYGKYFIDQKEGMWYSHFSHIKVFANS